MTDIYSAADALRHVTATADFGLGITRDRQARPPVPMTDRQLLDLALYFLGKIRDTAVRHIDALGLERVTYDDGRAVITSTPLSPDVADEMVWIWDPDPGHSSNQPRVIDPNALLPNGEHRRIEITAPGVIETFPVKE